jgi:hypothetical protein
MSEVDWEQMTMQLKDRGLFGFALELFPTQGP